MVRGNFGRGDYFIDCSLASESVLRSVFGVWINVFLAVIAISIRSVFRATLKRRLVNIADKRDANLWRVSPPTSPSEIVQLRFVLARSVIQGDVFYAFASLLCVIVAIVSSASTAISNHTIVSNVVPRQVTVPGRLAAGGFEDLFSVITNVSKRAQALDKANAPLEQLFDFIPEDTSDWIFVPDEWNNTWQGQCTYSKYPSVDLVLYQTNVTKYQEQVPLLGKCLPQWATVDPSRQSMSSSGFANDPTGNGTGAWRDLLTTYVFGSAPDTGDSSLSLINISIANYLAHHVAQDPYSVFLQTAIQSDVHIAECTFRNALGGRIDDQAQPSNGNYHDLAFYIDSVYSDHIADVSTAQGTVVQPTGQQMLRNFQAYMSVKDTQYPHIVQRKLTVSRPVVQIRLSVLVATVGAFLLSLLAGISSRWMEPVDQYGKRLTLPSSQFDWVVHSVREHYDEAGRLAVQSSSDYAKQRNDLIFVVSKLPDGHMTTSIASLSMTTVGSPSEIQPFLS